MPRKFSGESQPGERCELRKNGDIYVYERITAYNQQTKKTYTVSQKLKGKMKAGTQELISTRPKTNTKDTRDARPCVSGIFPDQDVGTGTCVILRISTMIFLERYAHFYIIQSS